MSEKALVVIVNRDRTDMRVNILTQSLHQHVKRPSIDPRSDVASDFIAPSSVDKLRIFSSYI